MERRLARCPSHRPAYMETRPLISLKLLGVSVPTTCVDPLQLLYYDKMAGAGSFHPNFVPTLVAKLWRSKIECIQATYQWLRTWSGSEIISRLSLASSKLYGKLHPSVTAGSPNYISRSFLRGLSMPKYSLSELQPNSHRLLSLLPMSWMRVHVFDQAIPVWIVSLGCIYVVYKILNSYLATPSTVYTLRGPPASSWLLGHNEVTRMYRNETLTAWIREYGSTFAVHGIFGVRELFLTDTKAVAFVLNQPSAFPKVCNIELDSYTTGS